MQNQQDKPTQTRSQYLPVIRNQQALVTQFFQTSSDVSTPEKLADVIADTTVARYKDLPEQVRKDWIVSQIFTLCYILHYQQPNPLDVKVDAAFADQMIMDDDGASSLKQVEMQEAFRRGIAKEYGEFYGITAQSLIQFLKGFRSGAKRQRAIAILYEKEQARIAEEKRNEDRLFYELRAHGFVNPWGKKEKKKVTTEESAAHREKIARQREEILKTYGKD